MFINVFIRNKISVWMQQDLILNSTTKISGGYGLFSGSLELNFKSSTKKSSFSAYSTVVHEKRFWTIRLPRSSELRNILKSDFKNALENTDAFELFDTFGTHYVASATIGARAYRHSIVDSRKFESNTSFSTEAEASYAKLVNFEHSTSYEKSSDTFDKNASSREVYIGGDQRNTYKEWQKTAKNRPVFIGFPDSKSLIPIWELTTNKELKSYLKLSFEKYSYDRASLLPKEPLCDKKQITDLEVLSHSSNVVEPSAGFQKINVDLNRRAGGKYIYLCKKHSRGTPINEMAVIEGKNKSAPKGWKIIKKDLNKGARGKYLYFIYQQCQNLEKLKGKPPIVNIKILSTRRKKQKSPGKEWKKIPVDLNWGAGGDYIYLYYKRGTVKMKDPNKKKNIKVPKHP